MRKLTLKKETLADLTAAELTDVVAAAPTVELCGPTLSFFCGSAYDDCITVRGCPTGRTCTS